MPSKSASSGVWPVVRAEREALVRDLEPLTPEQWTTPSLCPGWSVHDVLAHLVDDARTTRWGFVVFLGRLVLARFDFDRTNADGVTRERRDDPRETLAAFAAVTVRTTSAPLPSVTRLVEAFVHGEDVRRPLGLRRDYPAERVAAALRHQLRTSVGVGGGRQRAEGLRLVATDTDLVAGAGPEVRGSAIALLTAVSGRRVTPGRLTGPGAAALTG